MLIYVASALTVFGMAGLALDLGMAYIAKTRLQNAVDAAALDAAKTLDNGLTVADATTNATSTFTTNAAGVDTSSASLSIETSSTYTPFTAGSTPAHYVRVTIANALVRTYLINIFRGTTTLPMGASAVAGPEPTGGTICGAIPLALCGTDNGDTNCTDGNGCYGIPLEVTGEVRLKDSALSPGNYGLVQFGAPGAAALRIGMAGGGENCFDDGGTINTQTGSATGPSEGLNTRFNENTPPLDLDDYPGDRVTTGGTISFPIPTTNYATYSTLLATHVWNNPGGQPKRRVALSPIVDCSTLPLGSSAPANVIGSACIFLTRHVESGGIYKHNVFVEFIDSCRSEGGEPDLDGPGKAIVLYQSTVQG